MGDRRVELRLPKSLVALFPVPVVLITSVKCAGEYNIMTAGWVGVACSEPPMISVAIRPIRLTHSLIKESGEFVVNIPTSRILKEVDYCGTYSGRQVDKFKTTGLTPLLATRVGAPLIAECPINVECKVKDCISLGSHDLFIGEALINHAIVSVIDNTRKKQGHLNFRQIKPIAVNLFEYWSLGHKIGESFKVVSDKNPKSRE